MRATDHGAFGAECHRFEHVLAGANAAVQPHFNPLAHRFDNRRQLADARRCTIQLAATVVAHHQCVGTGIRGQVRIFWHLNAVHGLVWATGQAVWRQRALVPLKWGLVLVIGYVTLCLFAMFFDGHDGVSPRTSHLYFLVLTLASMLVFRNESPLLRWSTVAVLMASFVVFASSNHVTGFYKQSETIHADHPARPDGFYGLSKAFGEDLARLYFDRHGIETACVRIGSSFPEPKDRRMLATWLSFDDLHRLISACLSTPVLGHSIVFGMSDNAVTWWDNSRARHVGYVAKDSSDVFREAIYARTSAPDLSDPAATVARMRHLGRCGLVTFFAPACGRVGPHVEAIPGLQKTWIHHAGTAWLIGWWRDA